MHGLLNQFSSAVVGNIGAFVGAFMGEIVSKGSSFIIDKYRKYTLVNEKLETIEQLLPKIKSAIEESERRWITNEQLLQWLKTLIHAAYQADYVLETFNYRRMLEIEEKARNKITTVNTNGRNYIQSPHNIAKRIRTSYNCAKRMVMDDEEITQLGSVLQRLERAIYDVSEFRKLLEKCEVTVPRALRSQNSSLHGESLLFEEDLFELQWLIKQKLKKEKFLIVLDDVLQVDQITWSVLHDYLSCGKEGSKVIAASPSKEAVIKFDTVEPIELMGFQKEEYWFFFRDHAFGSAKPEHHPKLAIIGREIAKRMQGSPLAACSPLKTLVAF
ncbi:Disease resistance protein RGA2 [Rhynchospora pubera]|uniref:Disease resistance protein RGA2 n=1 Tax=Rhynchospora pubera TaxID=906938 RepID=A0AAV8DDT4_9POAL|nr:Disease resistance protein RGA2 [Rhynchospora pubera]